MRQPILKSISKPIICILVICILLYPSQPLSATTPHVEAIRTVRETYQRGDAPQESPWAFVIGGGVMMIALVSTIGYIKHKKKKNLRDPQIGKEEF